MGILDNITKNTANYSTKSFYFGMPEAEGENRDKYKLSDYFEDYLEILSELKKGKFIFTGRKGSGKTAIAKYIKDQSDQAKDSHAVLLRLKDFDLERAVQVSGNSGEGKDSLLFEWLILVNIVKLIVKNECGEYTTEYNQLRKFVEKNTGSSAIDKFEVSEVFLNNGGEIKFGMLTHLFGAVFKKQFGIKETKAPYYKLIAPLKEIVKIILDYPTNKETEFWLLFDDLDVGYNVDSESDNLKIMELLRIAKEYNTEIFQHNHARILVFLRDDMRNVIASKYNDSGKIFLSYEIMLQWYNHKLLKSNENDIPLKRLTNRRLTVNFKNAGIPFNEYNPWETLFAPTYGDKYTDFKPSFKYILDFTLYRPRDIIVFLSAITEDNYEIPINFESLKKILFKYINKLRTEIESELSLFFNEAEKTELFMVLEYIANHNCKREDVIQVIAEQPKFSFSAERVFSILEEYSLIGYKNQQGESFFKCREQDLDDDEKRDMQLTLPRCILHNFKKIHARRY